MLFALFFLLILIQPQPVQALNEFTIHQQIDYLIDQQGNAQVDQQVSLTNNISNIYAKEYSISLSGTKITNITGHDKMGDIIEDTTTSGENTIIKVRINDPAIGKDKTSTFRLNYTIRDFVTIKGKLAELSLPDYNNLSDQDQILISLKIPDTYGTLSFSSNPPINQSQSGNYHIINYKITSQNSKSKTMLAFGSSQLFDFELTYNLDNPKSEKVFTIIPVPPDTDFQTVIYKEFSPSPENITQNSDGNWLAKYYLEPNQKLQVKVTGQTKILPQSKKTGQSPPDYLDKLLSDSNYWHPSDPAIKQISASLKTPKQIYDYVISTLKYQTDPSILPSRKGDLATINSPESSVCTEFTDLFVSLARAAGIPAREIEGYAYSNNDKIKPINSQADVLHAWPQYWDKQKGWVSVDPTWGSTTNGIDFFNDLDLNHFTFVIHGENADYPPPPGSYRDSADTKTVDVKFAQSEIQTEINPIKLTIPKNSSTLRITNPNLTAATKVVVNNKFNNWSKTFEAMPPLSYYEVPLPKINFFKSLSPKNQKITFTTQIGDEPPTSTSILYLPHYLNLAISICFGILLLASIGLLITRSKS